MENYNKNKNRITRLVFRLLEICLTRGTVHKKSKLKQRLSMGRISIDLPDELEKQLRIKTVERFGGKKGDLSRAVEEAIKTWITKKE